MLTTLAHLVKPFRTEAGKWRGYVLGFILVALATILGRLLVNFFTPANIVMFYLVSVTLTAVTSGLVPSVTVSLLSVLAFDFFLVPPYYTFTVADTQYIVTFTALFIVGVVISYLTARLSQETEVAVRRERETATLYSMSRSLTIASGMESTLQTIVTSINNTFGRKTVILIPGSTGALKPFPDDPDSALTENERETAFQVFNNQKLPVSGLNAKSESGVRIVPLKTSRGTTGVVVLKESLPLKIWSDEQEKLLEVFADLAALVIEHNQLVEKARNTQILEATEKLQTALLNSISHDLRTPLVSIIGALSSLQDKEMKLDEMATNNLLQVAREQADYLNHTITNLLDVSRLEAGALKISRQHSDVQDLLGAALEQMGSRIHQRSIAIDMPENLPFISVDFGLIVQVLINIIDNAVKYSPVDSTINISARKAGKEVSIEIADRGVGIPPEDLPHVFDKFYRLNKPNLVAGTGLGLSICKGIVEAHGGHTTALNRPGGGSIINVFLPISNSNGENNLYDRVKSTGNR
jgi:two-component system sensor histidine kinase KdpD